MNRTLLILSNLLFISGFVLAQQHFEPGYIVQPHQDTLKGFIDYRNWSRNPDIIYFKTADEATVRAYGSGDISGFYVHSETYVKAEIQRNISPVRESELTESTVPLTVADTAFLLTVVDGERSLYYLNDENDRIQLYVGQGQQYELLIYYRYKRKTEAGTSIISPDRYKQQLKNYFSDCPAVESRFANMSYSRNAIVKIFGQYYKACGNKPKFISTKERISLETGIVAGVSATSISFTGKGFPYLVKSDFDISYKPTAGLFLNLVFPRTQRKLSLANDLTYTSYELSGSTVDFTNTGNYTNNIFSMQFGYLKLNNMIRYRAHLNKLSLYFNVGISTSFKVKEVSKLRKEIYFHTEEPDVKLSKALEETKGREQGVIAGVGSSFGKFGIEARFEVANGCSFYSGLGSPVRRGYLLVSYNFR